MKVTNFIKRVVKKYLTQVSKNYEVLFNAGTPLYFN